MIENKKAPVFAGASYNVRYLFFHLLNYRLGYTGEGEPSIVEEVLHGDHFGQVREERHAVISALVGAGIAQRTHLFGIAKETFKTLYTRAGRSTGRRLRNGINAHLFLGAVIVPKAAGNAFQESLVIGHIIIIRKYALRGDVG